MAFAILGAITPASAHHRHHYYYHWAGFPNVTINVYHCNLASYTSYIQAAITNWNANGGFGTVFAWGGANCNPPTGIVATYVPSLAGTSGQLLPISWAERTHEVLKETAQPGRALYQSFPGQYGLTKAELGVSAAGRSSTNVYAHELGHAVGLNEHYNDITGILCTSYFLPTIMDCVDGHTGPLPHDAADGPARFNADPWGPGAVWISGDTGTQLTLNWADINDNETGYDVYKDGALVVSKAADSESHLITGLTPGANYCFYVKVRRGSWSGFSSDVCRNWTFGGPSAAINISATALSGHSATVSWTTTDAGIYTHEWVSVYEVESGYQAVAKYYVRYHSTGAYSHFVNLGVNDLLPGTYYIEVYTCSARHNAYNSLCTSSGSTTVYLSGS